MGWAPEPPAGRAWPGFRTRCQLVGAVQASVRSGMLWKARPTALVLCAPGHVLESPGIAVWVGELGVEDPAGVFDRAYGGAAVDECRAGLFDVADHQVQAAQGSGRHVEPRDARGQGDRAG